MKIIRCRIEWKLQDLWVGVFWKTTNCLVDSGEKPLFTDVWICILPCVPIHLTLMHHVVIDIRKDGAT